MPGSLRRLDGEVGDQLVRVVDLESAREHHVLDEPSRRDRRAHRIIDETRLQIVPRLREARALVGRELSEAEPLHSPDPPPQLAAGRPAAPGLLDRTVVLGAEPLAQILTLEAPAPPERIPDRQRAQRGEHQNEEPEGVGHAHYLRPDRVATPTPADSTAGTRRPRGRRAHGVA